MKKIWDKRGCHWYSKKDLGKLHPNKEHPDYLRDRLNEKGMKKLNKLQPEYDIERYLKVGSKVQILIRVILKPWKWKLSLISPSTKGGTKGVLRWEFIAEERYGRIRHMVLLSNPSRDRILERI